MVILANQVWRYNCPMETIVRSNLIGQNNRINKWKCLYLVLQCMPIHSCISCHQFSNSAAHQSLILHCEMNEILLKRHETSNWQTIRIKMINCILYWYLSVCISRKLIWVRNLIVCFSNKALHFSWQLMFLVDELCYPLQTSCLAAVILQADCAMPEKAVVMYPL